VVEGHTTDGTTGSITIDGQKFELQAGALFLVATRGEKPLIKQLRREGLRIEKEAFWGMAKADAEVGAFFGK
jgi:hypothetical protein